MSAARPSRPGWRPIVGHLPAFRHDPLGFLIGTAHRFGDVVPLRLGPWRAYLLSHPDHAQHVLQTNHRGYAKRTVPLRQLGAVLGQGLVTSDGALWRQQRRVIQPAFHRARMAEYLNAMTTALGDMAHRWSTVATRGCVVEVRAEMVELAFRVVGAALFGTDLQAVAERVRDAVTTVQQQTTARLYRLVAPPLWVPTRPNRSFRTALATLDDVAYTLIDTRRRARTATRDLLSILLEARDERGERIGDQQVRDEILTLLLAGHENTANALTWAAYLLALHPDVADRLACEAQGVIGHRLPDAGDLNALPYARAVAEEALRLYPTSWLLLRRAIADDQIGGCRIVKGAIMLISPYVIHRHSGFWPDPERFDPGRFCDSGVATRHPFAYMPFGAGMRKCIGARFAAAEMHLAIATLGTRFRFDLAVEPPVEPEPLVSLPPRGGMPMRIRSR